MNTVVKDETLEEKWSSYRGLGINATKGEDSLVLREACGGGQFAIVELKGGCWTNFPMKVIEEIDVVEQSKAETRFEEVAKQLGYQKKPVRGIEQFFAFR
jgi:hypothetical protein